MRASEKGFTLIEVLVVLGLSMALAFSALTFSIPMLRATRVEGFVEDMSSLIFLYQQRAAAGKFEKSYGVYFDTDSYAMFVGDSYATAEDSDLLTYPADISTVEILLDDGGNEIVFASKTFHPSTYGSVRITNGGKTFVLVVNKEGLIYEYKE